MKILIPLGATLSLLACTPNAAAPESETVNAEETAMPNIIVQSSNDFATTETKLLNAIEDKGLKLFATVDHGKGARSIDADIGESKLFIFGNPKAGTPLMIANAQMGLELPLKILISSANGAAVQISYSDIAATAKRYDVAGKDELIGKIGNNLSDLAEAAAR